MKRFEYVFLHFWAFVPWVLILVVIPLLMATGCSPAGVRIAEEVIEDVAEEELKR